MHPGFRADAPCWQRPHADFQHRNLEGECQECPLGTRSHAHAPPDRGLASRAALLAALTACISSLRCLATTSSWDRFVRTSGSYSLWKVSKEMMQPLMFLDHWVSNHHLKCRWNGPGAGGSNSQSRCSRSAHLLLGGIWALVLITTCRMRLRCCC
jgi:hypothetical protein